jgi:hypothetical protein
MANCYKFPRKKCVRYNSDLPPNVPPEFHIMPPNVNVLSSLFCLCVGVQNMAHIIPDFGLQDPIEYQSFLNCLELKFLNT